jgi:hypothetical protein
LSIRALFCPAGQQSAPERFFLNGQGKKHKKIGGRFLGLERTMELKIPGSGKKNGTCNSVCWKTLLKITTHSIVQWASRKKRISYDLEFLRS